jgi:hypothetical protein
MSVVAEHTGFTQEATRNKEWVRKSAFLTGGGVQLGRQMFMWQKTHPSR